MHEYFLIRGGETTTDVTDIGEVPGTASLLGCTARAEDAEMRPRIALLTPYNGGNLGDAALQDSMIANLRLRLPGAQFSGICLNLENIVAQHGINAFPLCGIDIPFYHMLRGSVTDKEGERFTRESSQKGFNARIKGALKRVPVLGSCLLAIRACFRELRHWIQGYRFLRTQDLLIVSGGGQLNEQWGGPWGQPFALFKWAVLARIAQIPYVIASVGVGKVTSTASRLFLSTALRIARYRSYRDKNSRAFAMCLLQPASNDPIVPDLAFSLPSSEIPQSASSRASAQGQPTIAISPIAYAKPRRWPSEDRALYDRYVGEMARVVSRLLDRGYFLVIVCSSLWDDESAISDIVGRLDDRSKNRFGRQVHIPSIVSWKDFVASIRDVDFLIVSRLHSAILGFITDKPTVAISFDPKVDWVMEDLGQTDYLLQIGDFVAEDVLEALDRIELRRSFVKEQIGSYRRRILSTSAMQYDALAELALASRRVRS